MTTTEAPYALSFACDLAGNGGVVQHVGSGAKYRVGQLDSSGEWCLTTIGDYIAYTDAPLSRFVQGDWVVLADDDSLGEFEEKQSATEFFNSLSMGTVICNRTYNCKFAYMGEGRNDNGERTFHLANLRWFDKTVLLQSDCDSSDNTWSRIPLDDNKFEEIGSNMVNVISVLWDTQLELGTTAQLARTLQEEISTMTIDFETVNSKLCEYAVDKGYCSDFEYYIEQWNQDLQKFKLLGRPRQFSIDVEIVGLGDFQIEVTARTEKEARDEVENMSVATILRELLSNGEYFGEAEVHIGDTEDRGV